MTRFDTKKCEHAKKRRSGDAGRIFGRYEIRALEKLEKPAEIGH